jgi:hypothetical protein
MQIPLMYTLRTLAVCRIGKLMRHLSHQTFALPCRAVASDDTFRANKSVGFGGIIADTDGYVRMEGANRYGMCRDRA